MVTTQELFDRAEASDAIRDLEVWQRLIQKHGSFEQLLIKVNQKAVEISRGAK